MLYSQNKLTSSCVFKFVYGVSLMSNYLISSYDIAFYSQY